MYNNSETNIKTIYCDFDGTITKKDAVNTFFELYADKKWLEYEEQWVQGKITSRENAIAQVALLQNVSRKILQDYIDSIEIDEYFSEFLEFIKLNNIKLFVLSDGFDLFIQETLKRYKDYNITIYANHLTYNDGKFNIDFPNFNPNCRIGAGMCKCSKIKEEKFCYIGDGTSDLCVAKKADTLFATKKLAEYCKKISMPHYYFKNFKDIINKLEKLV